MAALTDKGMQSKPTDRDQWLRRPFARGSGVLEGRITPAGARSFYFRYTDDSDPATPKRVRLPIGPYSARGTSDGLTLQQADTIARQWSQIYQSGVHDLREHFDRERQAKAAQDAEARARADMEATRSLTVRGLFERWQATELAPRVGPDGKRVGRKDGGEYIRLLFEARVFPAIGDHIVPEIRKVDLMPIIDKARTDGRLRTANVLLTTLKQMFRFALARDLVGRNPLDTVTKRDAGGSDVLRDRVLSWDEIKALAKALPTANMNGRSVAAVWLILATGARVSEAMGARWEHVDLDARTWHLPETKNGRDHTIHLSGFAKRQFQTLAALRPDITSEAGEKVPVPWVFPNSTDTGSVDVTTFGKQIADRQRSKDRRLQRRTSAVESLKLHGGRWTAHDLRRTAATLMAEAGISGDVIDECLNHVIESRVRRTYIRDRRLPEQARAFDVLGARLEQAFSDRTPETKAAGRPKRKRAK